MLKKLVIPALTTFIIGAAVLGLLLFLPAWSFSYWQAWVFIVVFQVCVSYIGIYLTLKDPALLERRKQVGPAAEQSPAQRIIMTMALLSIFGRLIYCALDARFSWSPVPAGLSLVGDGMVALGLYLNLLVFKENSFGGANVQTFEDQKVISTGLYGVVRHPMYLGVLIMMAGVPLALGAARGFAVFAILLPGLAWRILDEEKLLQKDLPGYVDYMKKVRYRLVPYLW